MVPQVVINRQLQPLRIDHHKLNLGRMGFVQNAGNDAVQTDTLAGTSGPGDEHVRHVLQVRNERLAGDGFAQHNRQRRIAVAKRPGVQDVSQVNNRMLPVGDFDANCAFARYRRHDADAFGAHGHSKIIR
ncbi:hypothetical protein MnTg02_01766 [bacterium MnTg02]|nr:hypothetical protein MnTg02_01766 [bacterium MnTg02]